MMCIQDLCVEDLPPLPPSPPLSASASATNSRCEDGLEPDASQGSTYALEPRKRRKKYFNVDDSQVSSTSLSTVVEQTAPIYPARY